MKKIILGLFLMLGAVSFSAPKYVNTTKLENAGYEITGDDADLFSFGKATQEAGISVAFYPVTDANMTAKYISEGVKASAPDEVKFISSIEFIPQSTLIIKSAFSSFKLCIASLFKPYPSSLKGI